MSTSAKNIVKKFYQTDFVKDAQAGMSLLHDDIVLIWNSTEGLTIMHQKEIVETFEEVSRTYEELRIEVSHVLEDENLVNATCYDTTSFYIEVRFQPIIDIVKTWYLCPGEDLQLYVNSIHDEYLWSNGKTDSEITINKAGSYSVTVYNVLEGRSKCGVTETIQVLDTEIPKSVAIIETDWTVNNNSIEVYVDGMESYLFSIDGDVYQSSNVFNNLEAGDYTVYVKNERDCLLYSEDVYLLNYPKFFREIYFPIIIITIIIWGEKLWII